MKTIQYFEATFVFILITNIAFAGIQIEITSSPVSDSLTYEQSMSAAIVDAKPPIHYLWDFGDNSVSYESNPVHSYISPGEYRIWLNILDADGQTANAVYWVQIRHDLFQKDQLLIKHYLNTLDINCIYQDHYQTNYVWIGTNGGLIRVDIAHNHQQYYRSQLPSEKVNDICQLFDNSLWFATNNGLVRYDVETNQWSTFNTANTPMTENHVNTLAQSTDQKKLWVGTMGGGIICWDTLNRQWLEYSAINTDLISNHIQDLSVDTDDNLWIATHRGISVLNPYTNQWQLFTKDNCGLLENIINVISCAENGTVWVGTWNYGIASFNKSNNEWQTYHSNNSPLKKNYIENLISTSDGNIWIAAQEKGLFSFCPETNSWNVYSHNNSSLPDASINGIASIDGHTVIISAGDSLIQMDEKANTNHCIILRHRYLPDNSISSVIQSKNETLWLGFRNKGLTNFDPNSHQWTVWNPMNSPLPSYDVRCIEETSDTQIAVGTSNGLALYDDNYHQWSIYLTDNSDIVSNNVTSLLYDKNAFLWIGTTNGLSRFNPATLQWKNFTSFIVNENITCIAQSMDGIIWAGTSQNGLLKYQEQNNTWQRFNQGNSNIADNHIQGIIGTSSDNLWIATLYSGLLQFNLYDETWKSYDTSNTPLLRNTLTSLNSGINDILWIGDNDSHLYRFNSMTQEWHIISLNENIEDASSVTSVLSLDENNLWMATQGSGLYHMSWPQSLESPGNLLVIQAIEDYYCDESQRLSLENIYRIFSNNGFRHHDIMMIAQTDELDINGDGLSDSVVDDAPTIENICTAINQLAIDKNSSDKPLFIFILGKWSTDENGQPTLHLPGNQAFNILDFHKEVALYEQKTGAKTIVVLNGMNTNQCLSYLSTSKRMIITSGPLETNTNETSIFGSFLHFFLNELESRVTVYEAYNQAKKKEAMWLHKKFSIPALDDNGDGLSDNLDGVFASQIQLKGTQQNNDIPVIQNITTKITTSNSIELTTIYNANMAQANAKVDLISSDSQENKSFTINLSTCRPMTFNGELMGITPTGTYELSVMAHDFDGRIIVSDPSIIMVGSVKTGSLKGNVQLVIGQYPFSYNDAHLTIHLSQSDNEAVILPDGSFFIDNIPEGTYQLELSGPNFHTLLPDAIDIKTGETREVAPIRFNIEKIWCSLDVNCNDVIDLKDIIFLLQQLTL